MPALRLFALDGTAGYAESVHDCIRLGGPSVLSDPVTRDAALAGCSASRAMVVGAFVAAERGVDAIPVDWIARLKNATVLDDCTALVLRALDRRRAP